MELNSGNGNRIIPAGQNNRPDGHNQVGPGHTTPKNCFAPKENGLTPPGLLVIRVPQSCKKTDFKKKRLLYGDGSW